MSDAVMKGKVSTNLTAMNAKKELTDQFFKQGLMIGLFSGVSYGLYSAFMTFGMTKGVWADWYGANMAGLSVFTITYVLGALGSAVNDIFSAISAIIYATVRGKLGDFFRTINTTPGRMMVLAALVGGPVASTAYVVGLQMAGSIVIPITALCPAIGAILSRILYKQKITKRTALGISICVLASFIIGSASISGDAADGALLGMGIAFIAALGWGFEGCVAGYGTSMIDSEIGITIRQTTSGLSNLIVLLPLFAFIAGDINIAPKLAIQAFTSGPAVIWFAISGFFAFMSFMTWYKGNSMVGTALGMALNGTYSFFGPFFCWILLGVIGGIDGWSLPPIVWGGAILMTFGILIIAVNPLDFFRKKEVL